jgi:hypothetical protein
MEEHAVGELVDVCFVQAGDLLAAPGPGQLEGIADRRRRTGTGDHLQALGDIRRLHVFDAAVGVFDVLPDDDHVQAGPAVGHAGQRADRSDVGIQIEGFADEDVDALVAAALGGGGGTLQGDGGLAQGLERLVRQAAASGPDA